MVSALLLRRDSAALVTLQARHGVRSSDAPDSSLAARVDCERPDSDTAGRADGDRPAMRTVTQPGMCPRLGGSTVQIAEDAMREELL